MAKIQGFPLPAFVELPSGQWIPLAKATRPDIEASIKLEKGRQDASRVRELKALLRFLENIGFLAPDGD